MSVPVLANAVRGAIPDPGIGTAPPGSDKLTTLLQYGAWVFFAGCVAGILYACSSMFVQHQRGGGGGEGTTKLIWTLVATIVGASASGLVGAFAS